MLQIKNWCPRHILATVLIVALAMVLGGFTVIAPAPGQPSDNSTLNLSIGISNWTFDQWIDVGLSLLIFLAIASLGGRVRIWLGRQIARRTNTTIDDTIISSLSRPLQWLGTIIGFQIAYLRLDLITADWREFLDNVSFVLYVVVAGIIIWQLINHALTYYRKRAQAQDADMKSIDRLLPLVRTFLKGLLVIIGIFIILHHFGIEITAAVAALGITGFAISLAAKDTLTNMISGVIIAVDRPFRIGDRIYSESAKGWVESYGRHSQLPAKRCRRHQLQLSQPQLPASG
jgi:small-conductance mechanosensitive channel